MGSSPAVARRSRTEVIHERERPEVKTLSAGTDSGLSHSVVAASVPESVETDPDGVDFGWVMQVTFVATILIGAPLVAALSAGADLPTWEARAAFAIRVGAPVWFLTSVLAYAYARYRR